MTCHHMFFLLTSPQVPMKADSSIESTDRIMALKMCYRTNTLDGEELNNFSFHQNVFDIYIYISGTVGTTSIPRELRNNFFSFRFIWFMEWRTAKIDTHIDTSIWFFWLHFLLYCGPFGVIQTKSQWFPFAIRLLSLLPRSSALRQG